MGSSTCLRLPADRSAPRAARAQLRLALPGVARRHLDAALLLVTELVTNAVVHGGTGPEVTVGVDPTGNITVRVTDADTGPLDARRADEGSLDEGGRGLLLVDALASAWGTEHVGGAKAVWFRMGGENPAPRPAVDDVPSGPRPEGGGPVAPVASGPAPQCSAEALLDLLVLDPRVVDALEADEHLAALLDRLADATGAAGAELRLAPDRRSIRRGTGSGRAPVRVPLRLADRDLGMLTLDLDRPTSDQRAILELGAARLALRVAETRLHTDEQRRASRLAFLAEASELLAGILDARLALTLTGQLVVPRFADWSVVHEVDDRGRVVLVNTVHRDERLADSVAEAVEDGVLRAVTAGIIEDLPGRTGRWIEVAGQCALVATLPLRARGRVVGALTLGGRALDGDDLGVASDLARRAAFAIDNARLYAEQAEVARALQSQLLPRDLPTGAGVDLAARYVPATAGLLVGGDFYDVVPAPGDGSVLVIGDVCGKGAAAAAVTGLVRDGLRLLLRENCPLAEALRRVDAALLERDELPFCTVALVGLTPHGAALSAEICLAGHPLPVLVKASGTVRLVGQPGPLLGVLDDQFDITPSHAMLEPGDALVLYTDGLTERRAGDREFGEQLLLPTLATCAGRTAAEIAARLEAAARSFVSTPLRDDLAVLVARAAGTPLSVPDPRAGGRAARGPAGNSGRDRVT